MLGEIGQQQKRARVEIGDDQDERNIGRATQAGGERSTLLTAQQAPPERRKFAIHRFYAPRRFIRGVSLAGRVTSRITRVAKMMRHLLPSITTGDKGWVTWLKWAERVCLYRCGPYLVTANRHLAARRV